MGSFEKHPGMDYTKGKFSEMKGEELEEKKIRQANIRKRIEEKEKDPPVYDAEKVEADIDLKEIREELDEALQQVDAGMEKVEKTGPNKGRDDLAKKVHNEILASVEYFQKRIEDSDFKDDELARKFNKLKSFGDYLEGTYRDVAA